MDNQELLSQVVSVIKEQTEAMTSYIDQRIDETEQRITKRIELKIENEVTKKIEALFDGYKLTHEKQWELERKTEALQAKMEEIQNRLLALESKTA